MEANAKNKLTLVDISSNKHDSLAANKELAGWLNSTYSIC